MPRLFLRATLALPLLLLATPYTQAASDELIQGINTSWILIAGVLVFLMQAGFALLESGASRAKNAVNVVMKNYMDVCVCSLIFWAVGYGLMFGDNPSGWLGGSHFFSGNLSDWDWAFLFFQMMFAATAATIASGAMAERIHFSAYLVGACFISGLIYPVFGSWAWGSAYSGSGWLKELGFIDFAGSTVVHSVGAWAALAGILVLGPRTGRFGPNGEARTIPGHNIGLVALGGFLLWFGWFGFNAGSSLEVGTGLGKIALNTHLAACAGAAGYMLTVRLMGQPLLLSGTVNGSLAGLVGITAGCGSMEPHFAALTGVIAGILSYAGSRFMLRLKFDDVVDAITVHGFCGVWGTLAAGIFFNEDPFNLSIIGVQALGAGVAFLWSFGMALLCYYLIDPTG